MKKRNGFTLLEMSIVLVIAGMLLVTSGDFATNLFRVTRIRNTKTKIQTIQKSLENYLVVNGNLPCPASLTASVAGSAFGVEERSALYGTCNTGGGVYSSGDVLYGAVPVEALNLSNSTGVDEWGNKISYVVDARFAEAFAGTSNGVTALTVEANDTGANSTTSAVYALISHGGNEYGAFSQYSDTAMSIVGSIAAEQSNMYNGGSGSLDSTFVGYMYDEQYDDIVAFKTKMQLLRDSQYEYVGCPTVDFDIPAESLTISGDSGYGDAMGLYEEAENTDGTRCRKCYKYGRWGDSYDCE